SSARDPALHQQAEADRASSRAAWSDAAQVKQGTDAMRPEAQQPLEKALEKERRRAEAKLPSKTRDEAAQLKQATKSATAELRQSLKKEHDRAEALARELARAQRDIETQAALSSKTGAEATQLKQAAESATAELRQSLQQEHDRAEALAAELAGAQRPISATRAAVAASNGDEGGER